MKIGFIGAGKVGCSLGRYFSDSHLDVAGFYDAASQAAQEAADFSQVRAYDNKEALVNDCDILFLTVPDGLIKQVWNQIKDFPVEGKYICHCSGALSAGDAFPEVKERGAFGYSIHPLFAVSDKFHSYKELSHAYFTIEGDDSHVSDITAMLEGLGNQVRHIKAEDKTKYHCAAAVVSNHIVGILASGMDLMTQCGFDEKSALQALSPLILGNVNHVLTYGPTASLTGPVERGDISTVQKHLNCLDTDKDKLLYSLISEKLVEIGKKKNPSRDYSKLTEVLREVTN